MCTECGGSGLLPFHRKDGSIAAHVSLKELLLTFKQSLKFLDAFSLRLKDKVVFLAWQAHQISRSIIIPDSVQMMNMPSLWQKLIVYLFPNEQMFCYVSLKSLWVSRAIYKNISIVRIPPPLPLRMILPRILLVKFSQCATPASLRPAIYFLATAKAISRLFLPQKRCAAEAPSGFAIYTRLSAVNARFRRMRLRVLRYSSHIDSILRMQGGCQV